MKLKNIIPVLIGLLIPVIAFTNFPNADSQFFAVKNFLLNPGFEQGKANWRTNSGAISLTSTVANLSTGVSGATFTASGPGQTFGSSLVTLPAGLYNRSCLASVYYKGGDNKLDFFVQNSSGTSLAYRSLSNQTTFKREDLSFICPGSGSLRVGLQSAAAATAIFVDDFFLGENYLSGGSLISAVFTVTNTTTLGVRVETADINCDGSSTINSQQGSWLSSVGNISSGQCAVTIISGKFSATPYCYAINRSATTDRKILNINSTSATALTTSCFDEGSVGNCASYDAVLTCIGSR